MQAKYQGTLTSNQCIQNKQKVRVLKALSRLLQEMEKIKLVLNKLNVAATWRRIYNPCTQYAVSDSSIPYSRIQNPTYEKIIEKTKKADSDLP